MFRQDTHNLALGWEKALIGTALAEPASMQAASDILPSDLTGCHQVIWAEMLSLSARSALELRTLVEALRSQNQLREIASFDVERPAEGEAYIAKLLSYRGDAMDEYARQVMQASTRRELRKVTALIRSDAEDERVPVDEALDAAERRLLALRRSTRAGRTATMADLLQVLDRRITGLLDGSITPAWVPKIERLREAIGYVDDEDYVLVAARPGEGKSSLMRYEIIHMALDGKPGAIFNLENSEIEYAKFAISMLANIDSDRLKNPRRLTDADKQAYRAAAERLARAPIYITTLGAPPVREIERRARQLILEKHVGIIGVDYVQLVNNGRENKVQDVSETSGALRAIALNFKVPVIANSQMSRKIETRGEDSEPQLSDLRDSGSLEQDGTMILFPRSIWPRPTDLQLRSIAFNVNPETQDLYPQVKALPVKIHVAKNRNGGTGVTRPILWHRATNNFYSIQSENV